MHVLITRPEPDAAELKEKLAALGHEATIEPLLQIAALPIEASALTGAQALIATSRNGLRALAESKALSVARKLPVFAVGADTAALARVLGFARVMTGPGAARDLVALVVADSDPAQGPLVHLAGETLAFDFAAPLAAHGLEVRKVAAYRAVAAGSFSRQTAQRIADGAIDAVILMSPRTAAIFAQLVGNSGLKDCARRLTYVCLSESVAAALGELAPERCAIAAAPNSEAMLAALARVASQSTGV